MLVQSLLNRFVCVALLAALLDSSPTRAEPVAATRVPADAAIVVTIDDLTTYIERSANSPGSKGFKALLTAEARYAEISDDLGAEIRRRLSERLGVAEAELRSPFGGSAAFYLIPRPSDDDEFQAVLSVGIQDRALVERYHQGLLRSLESAPREVEVQRDGDTQLIVVRPQEGAPATTWSASDVAIDATKPYRGLVELMLRALSDPAAVPQRFVIATTPDRWILASSKASATRALRAGSMPSLDSVARYRTLHERSPAPGGMRIYIDIPKLMKTAAKRDPDVRREVKRLGLHALGPAMGHIYLPDAPQNDFRADLFAEIDFDQPGIAPLLRLGNAPIDPPDFVAENSMFYFAMGADLGAITEAALTMTRQVAGVETEQIVRTKLREFETPTGDVINLYDDLLKQLRPPTIMSLGVVDPIEPESTYFLIYFAHANRDSIYKVLARFGLFEDEFESAVTFRHPLFANILLAVDDQRMMLGTRHAIERRLEGELDRPLSRSKVFRQLAQHVEEDAALIYYENNRRTFDIVRALAPRRNELMINMFQNPANLGLLFVIDQFEGGFSEESEDVEKMIEGLSGAGLTTLRTEPWGLKVSGVRLVPDATRAQQDAKATGTHTDTAD